MKNIIIAGGSTRGYIYPAITIAKAILKLNSEWEVEFVGTAEGLEAKIIPREGFKISFISVGKLNYAGSLFKKIKTLLRLPWSFIKCLALVIEKKPVLVLGVGGYVSGPFVLASSIMGVPTALWEPNAHPGLTNRLLARFVRKCFIVFEEAKKHLKARSYMKVGIPVREEIEKLNSYADAHHARAVAAGAQIVYDIKDEDYGGRGYSCLDPERHLCSFGTYDPWA